MNTDSIMQNKAFSDLYMQLINHMLEMVRSLPLQTQVSLIDPTSKHYLEDLNFLMDLL